MFGYSWLNISLDHYARQRMVNLSEPIDRTLSDGWYETLFVKELYKGFAKFADRFDAYYVLGRCDKELKLGQGVSGLVRTEGNAVLLRDNLNRIWINTVPEQDLIGPYKTIEQAKSELKTKGLTECRRLLVFYKTKEEQNELCPAPSCVELSPF
jgi:hypothetical protein